MSGANGLRHKKGPYMCTLPECFDSQVSDADGIDKSCLGTNFTLIVAKEC